MTNYEWLQSLNINSMAKMIGDDTCEMCIYGQNGQDCKGKRCEVGVKMWLEEKHGKPMPELKEGDCLFFQDGSNLYQAFCIHGNIVYCIENGSCHIFDGKLKEDTVVIRRYNAKIGSLEDIWRGDYE